MANRDLARWARTTEFETPIDWAAIEDRIRAETASPEELAEAERLATTHGGLGLSLAQIWISRLLLLLVAIPIIGAPAIGTALVHAHTHLGWNPSGDFAPVGIKALFIAGVSLAAAPALIWRSTKRRTRGLLAWSAINIAASATSLLLLTTQTSRLVLHDPWPSAQVLTATALVVALVGFGLLCLIAKPGPHTSRHQGPLTAEVVLHRFYRRTVLHQMTKRSLVNGHDAQALVDLPLGAWYHLVSEPDGRVVYRTSPQQAPPRSTHD